MVGYPGMGAGGDDASSRQRDVEVSVLGPIQVWIGEHSLDLGSPMERCVLAVLILECGRPVPFDVVATRLWGGRLPAKSRGTLSSYVSRIRRRLREAGAGTEIRSDAHTYTLVLDPNAVDLHRFRRLEHQAHESARSGDEESAVDLLKQATGLWRSEALTGLPGDWIPRMRESLEEERRRVLYKRIDLELRLGRHSELTGELRRLVATYPSDERFVGQLMRALYQGGRPVDALDLYTRTWRLLWETQAVEPSVRLQQLQQQILNGDSNLAIAQAHQSAEETFRPNTLPPNLESFTGRAFELALLTTTSRLTPDNVQAVVIAGMPGVGKTSLAVHAAHQLAARYPDAQLFLRLHGHDPQHPLLAPAGALTELLGMIGIPAARIPHTVEQRLSMWRTEIANRRAIVVLDDAIDADQIRPLLPRSSTCLLIVTTRRKIRELKNVQYITLDAMPTEDAASLFRHVAASTEEIDERLVESIVNFYGNLPLAVTLAARWMRENSHLTDHDKVENLMPTDLRSTGINSEDSAVRRAFERSYQKLSTDQQQVFRRLGLHPCVDITSYAAAALNDTTIDALASTIELLLDHHLLNKKAENSFYFHGLIGGYARDLATGDDPTSEQRTALRRLMDYYLEAANRADRLLHPHSRRIRTTVANPPIDRPALATPEEARSWMEIEWQNILRLVQYAIDHEWGTYGICLAHLMTEFLDTTGHWEEAAVSHELALRASRELGDLREIAQASAELSLDELRTGRHDLAFKHASDSLTAYRRLNDTRGEAQVLDHLGVIHWSRGRNREALAHSQEALALYRNIEDRKGEADTLAHTAMARWHLGRYNEAIRCLHHALSLYRAIRDRRGEAKTLNNIGNALQQRGYHREARNLYQESFKIFSEISGRQNRAILKNNIGNILQYKGDYQKAIDSYRIALDVFQKTGDQKNVADVLNNIGATYQLMGYPHEALAHHQKARAIAEKIADAYEHTWAIRGIADALRGVGNFSESLGLYRDALSMAREIGDLYQEARIYSGLAEASLHLDGIEAARIHWRQALDLFNELEVPEAQSLELRLQAIDGIAS